MRSTIVNFFFKQQRTKTPLEIEEETKRREERQKIKDEKRIAREKEEAKSGVKNDALKAKISKPKKDKKKGPNILSAEDKINEFMRQMHHKDGDV